MGDTEKKEDTQHVEDKSYVDEPAGRLTVKQQRRLRQKLDLRLLPALGLMYGISLMDRKNVSNAAIAGMMDELKLRVGYRYSLITLSFFITYVVFQAPTTILCRKIGPRLFLPGICVLWGALVIGFGFAQNWQTLFALRFILGILEAGYFPGCVYLLSTWYTRFQVAKRYSIFYLTGSLASALSGILAFGLMQMEGVQGIRGWRWIFIMEGVITSVIAILSYTLIVRFPDEEIEKPSYKFLTQDECKYVIGELDLDRGDVEVEPFSWARFLKPAKDIEIWGFAFIFFNTTVVTYSFAFFLPIILKDNIGFSTAASQCLIAPPYVLSAVIMYCTSWLGDRYRMRAPILVFNAIVSVIGLSLMGFAQNNGVRYFGAFIGIAGINANVPAAMAYQANNIRGQWKRAFCSATFTGLGGVGGIGGSLVFRSQDAPTYIPGFIAVITCNVVVIITVLFLTLMFKRRNKLAEEGLAIYNESADFRYTI